MIPIKKEKKGIPYIQSKGFITMIPIKEKGGGGGDS